MPTLSPPSLEFVDPATFCGRDSYDDQVDRLASWLKSSKPREGFEEVLLPGEPEDRAQSRREAEGLSIEADTWGKLVEIAASLGVSVPKPREPGQ